MMICKKCQSEIDPNSYICPFCNYDITTLKEINKIKTKNNLFPKQLNKRKAKRLLLAFSFAVLLFLLLFSISFFKDVEKTFLRQINNLNFEKARQVYEKKILGDEKLERRVLLAVESLADEVFASFNEGALGFEAALEKINFLSTLIFVPEKIEQVKNDIFIVKGSKLDFDEGKRLLGNEEYIDAVAKFSHVSKIDKNYLESIALTSAAYGNYNEELMKIIAEQSASHNYAFIHEVIDNALIVYKNDADLTELGAFYELAESSFEDSQSIKMIAKLKNEQLLEVLEITAEKFTYKSLSDEELESYKQKIEKFGKYLKITEQGDLENSFESLVYRAVVVNKSDKKISSFAIASYVFGVDGGHLEVKSLVDSADLEAHMLQVRTVQKNIDALETYDEGSNPQKSVNDTIINLSEDDISRLEACILSVEFEDGSSWDNPYFFYWNEEQKP